MEPIYLDHAATTPVRTEVRAAMEPCLDTVFGNPSSLHRWGREAAAALDEARATCAAVLGARFSEIRFVRGGTESDNLAVQGRAAWLRAEGHVPTIAVSAVEHAAVLGAAAQATARGAGCLQTLPVEADGSLDLEQLDHVLANGPAVVSVMWVNNETGMVLPVEQVAERCRAVGATFHSDAVQGIGKIPVRVDEVPVDLLTVTGHKLRGPKGTGLLFCREGTYLSPLLHGGAQERALRPGTEDVAGAVGLAVALRLAVAERETEAARLASLRARLERELVGGIPGLRVNAGRARRAPHISSVSVRGLDGASLLMALDMEGLAVSGGAACHTGATSASHVIAALYGADDRHATVRFSLGSSTTAEQVTRAARVTAAVVARLQEMGAAG